jgi:hypothetical protein
VIVLISVLPIFIEVWRERRARRQAKAAGQQDSPAHVGAHRAPEDAD